MVGMHALLLSPIRVARQGAACSRCSSNSPPLLAFVFGQQGPMSILLGLARVRVVPLALLGCPELQIIDAVLRGAHNTAASSETRASGVGVLALSVRPTRCCCRRRRRPLEPNARRQRWPTALEVARQRQHQPTRRTASGLLHRGCPLAAGTAGLDITSSCSRGSLRRRASGCPAAAPTRPRARSCRRRALKLSRRPPVYGLVEAPPAARGRVRRAPMVWELPPINRPPPGARTFSSADELNCRSRPKIWPSTGVGRLALNDDDWPRLKQQPLPPAE